MNFIYPFYISINIPARFWQIWRVGCGRWQSAP